MQKLVCLNMTLYRVGADKKIGLLINFAGRLCINQHKLMTDKYMYCTHVCRAQNAASFVVQETVD